MSSGIRQHIRSNIVGYMALFVALSGTAYAIDGPLPGQNQVGSQDIINDEVLAADIGPDAVRTPMVLADTLLGEDIAEGAISSSEVLDESLAEADIDTGGVTSSEVLNGDLTYFDLGSDSVRYSELDPGAFNSEFADLGINYGIANDSIQSNEVSADSLSGSDINESTFAPSIDAVHAKGHDYSFGPPIASTETNVLTDNLNAGTWVVFAEVNIYNGGDATRLYCGIWTDDTEREKTYKHIEAEFDDSNYDVHIPMTAVFETTSPTALRLACGDPGDDGDLLPRSADLVAIPVDSVG